MATDQKDKEIERLMNEHEKHKGLWLTAEAVAEYQKRARRVSTIGDQDIGARRALRLPVGGAFHSPLMEPARQELEAAIAEAQFMTPTCPVYQNVDALPYTDAESIKKNLIAQLTAPVRWTQIVEKMLADGVTEFTEVGPGNVLKGLVSKVSADVKAESISTL